MEKPKKYNIKECTNCNGFLGHNLKPELPTYGINFLKPIKIKGATLFFNHIPDKGGDIRYQVIYD